MPSYSESENTYYCGENTSIDSDNSIYDMNSLNSKTIQNSKYVDRGFSKIYRIVDVTRSPTYQEIKSLKYKKDDIVNEKVRKCFEFYTTGYTPGQRIRHAISGVYENYYVGTKGEDHFLKVSLATGELGQSSYSHNLFFYGPKEYEDFFCLVLPEEIKRKWAEKQQRLYKKKGVDDPYYL
jgi:hypothetical protein